MTYLLFEVQQTIWVTHEPDPEDRWDRASTDGDVEVVSCKVSETNDANALPVGFDVKAGDTIWLVFAQYSTGDSFGTDGGCYELISVHQTEEEALKDVEIKKNVTDCSMPWNGYFESLDYIKAQSFVVGA